MPKASESIQTKKNQHAHHGRHEDKDLQEKHECAKIPINIRQALMGKTWSHPRIIDETQGSSKKKQDTN